MAETSVEQSIIDQNTKLNTHIDAFLLEAEEHIADLKATANLTAELGGPTVSFGLIETTGSSDDTNVVGDFDSGLLYPDASDIVHQAQVDGYDSAFLEFMEQSLRVDQSVAWATTVEALRAAYQTSITSLAQTFVTSLFPAVGSNGNTYASSMNAQVSDASTRHEVDYARFRTTLTTTLSLEFANAARDSGVGIEEIRAKVTQDMIGVHTDYNNAVLAKAETDLRALVQNTKQIHGQLALRLRRHEGAAKQFYEISELEQRKTLLELDVFMAEQSDEIRREHMDFKLQMHKAAALATYAEQAMSAAMLAKGVDASGVLTGTP